MSLNGENKESEASRIGREVREEHRTVLLETMNDNTDVDLWLAKLEGLIILGKAIVGDGVFSYNDLPKDVSFPELINWLYRCLRIMKATAYFAARGRSAGLPMHLSMIMDRVEKKYGREAAELALTLIRKAEKE